MSPQAKREDVATMGEKTAISERRACQLVGLSRTVLHYEPLPQIDNVQLQQRMIELASERS